MRILLKLIKFCKLNKDDFYSIWMLNVNRMCA